jgi:hypothetical protein
MSTAKDIEFRPDPVSYRAFRYACALVLVLSLCARCQQTPPPPSSQEPEDKSREHKLADDEEKKAIETVTRIADMIRNCREKSEIHRTTGKKPLYYREYEGPPSAVRFDLHKSDSVLAPYLGTLEFSTTRTVTPYVKTPQEAERDTRIAFLVWFPQSWTTRHRHVYRIRSDGFELDQRTYYDRNDQKWYLEESTPDSCWERVGYRFGVNESR